MLVIKSIDLEGKVRTREYDNNKAKFYENGELVELNINFVETEKDKEIEERGWDAPLPPEEAARVNNAISETHKSGAVSFLRLQIGMACNYNCAYCIQHNYGADSNSSTMEDVDNFIATFDDWCTVRKEDQHIHVQLWGGEPLMYVDKLKKLVPFFRGRFDLMQMSIVTNGSLLTKELVDFFLENTVQIVVSHDGPTNLDHRSGDPLAEGSESLKWIRYMHEKGEQPTAFNAVITKSNPDPVSTVEYIRKIMGDKPAAVGFEGIVIVEDPSHYSTANAFYSDEDYFILRESIRNGMASGSLADISPFNGKFQMLMSAWFSPTHMICKFSPQKCGMDTQYSLAANLKGEVLLCHSGDKVVGRLTDLASVSVHPHITHWSDRDCCRECIVLPLCKGACMIAEGEAWYHTCNNEFHFNLAVFEAAFEYIFKERIVRIDGHNHRPEKPLRRLPIASVEV